ncbi:MAG: response regulator [Bacillota bacterium]
MSRDGERGESERGPLILLVEDDDHIALALRICLELAGYSVEIAVDGVEALEKAFARRPHLVLLDIRLPKMNGHLVLKALREDVRTAAIPVIVTSAVAEVSEVEAAMEEGAQDYLVKPFVPSALVEVVRRYLERADD